MKKHLIYFCLLLIFCSSSQAKAGFFGDLGKSLDSIFSSTNQSDYVNEEPSEDTYRDDELATKEHTRYYRLTVHATPLNSTIKIMNILPKYYDGIRLTSGKYKVLVAKEGYKTYQEIISITHQDVEKNIILDKITKVDISEQNGLDILEATVIDSVDDTNKPIEIDEKINPQPSIYDPIQIAIKKDVPSPEINNSTHSSDSITKDNSSINITDISNYISSIKRIVKIISTDSTNIAIENSPTPLSFPMVEKLQDPIVNQKKILFDGYMGDRWLELAAFGGNFKKFAKVENKMLVVDVPEGNGKGKTGIRSAEPLVKVVDKVGKFSAKTTFEFNPKLSSDFIIALIPPDWNGNLEWRSHHIRVSLESKEDNERSLLILIIKGREVMKVDVKLHSIKQLNILLQPDHLVLVTDNKDNLLLQGMLNKDLSIPKDGYKISVLAAAPKNNKSASLALKKISSEKISYKQQSDIYGFLTEPKKVTLFDGSILGNHWQPYVDSKVKFGDAVRFKNHSFNVDIPENSGEANIGIKSSQPIIWLDQFGKGAERKISFKFNSKETTGFVLALSNVNSNFIVKWVKNPETKKAIVQVFVKRGFGLRSTWNSTAKPVWQQELSDIAPEEVIFTLNPGEITLSGNNLPEYTHNWPLIKANSAFDLYAYTSPIVVNKKVKMSLKEITLDQRILKSVEANKPLSGVKPLPVKTLFNKADSKSWLLTPWNSKKIPAESCLLNESGFMVSSVPKGAYLSGCNIHTDKKIITLDKRLDTGAYKLSAYFDPHKTKNFRIIWAPSQDRHNWSYCELSLLLSKHEQDQLILGCSYGSNHWQRIVSSEWLKSKWNGKVNLTLGKDWIEGGLDNGPSIRMNVIPESKLYLYVNSTPKWPHDKTNPELLFTRLTGEWVSNKPMDATARWDFIDDDKFDAKSFMREVSDEMNSFNTLLY